MLSERDKTAIGERRPGHEPCLCHVSEPHWHDRAGLTQHPEGTTLQPLAQPRSICRQPTAALRALPRPDNVKRG